MSSSQAAASSSTSYAATNPAVSTDAVAYSAVPDTQLGLTNEEIFLLRQGQQAVAASLNGGAAGSSSSRAASRASSQQQGLLLLDPGSLVALGRHFDRVMAQLGAQIQYLSEQAQVATTVTRDRAGLLAADADAEIARFEVIMAQLDELELDFDRVARIGEIVRGFRARAEILERELDAAAAAAPPGPAGRHRRHQGGHGHSGHSRQRR